MMRGRCGIVPDIWQAARTAPLPIRFPPPAAIRKSFCAAVRDGLWRRKRLFFQSPRSTILGECPARTVSAIPPHQNSLRGCWVLLGLSPADRQSMIYRNGWSPTTGPILFRSRKPRSRFSNAGSATSLMTCSGRNHDVRRSWRNWTISSPSILRSACSIPHGLKRYFPLSLTAGRSVPNASHSIWRN